MTIRPPTLALLPFLLAANAAPATESGHQTTWEGQSLEPGVLETRVLLQIPVLKTGGFFAKNARDPRFDNAQNIAELAERLVTAGYQQQQVGALVESTRNDPYTMCARLVSTVLTWSCAANVQQDSVKSLVSALKSKGWSAPNSSTQSQMGAGRAYPGCVAYTTEGSSGKNHIGIVTRDGYVANNQGYRDTGADGTPPHGKWRIGYYWDFKNTKFLCPPPGGIPQKKGSSCDAASVTEGLKAGYQAQLKANPNYRGTRFASVSATSARWSLFPEAHAATFEDLVAAYPSSTEPPTKRKIFERTLDEKRYEFWSVTYGPSEGSAEVVLVRRTLDDTPVELYRDVVLQDLEGFSSRKLLPRSHAQALEREWQAQRSTATTPSKGP